MSKYTQHIEKIIAQAEEDGFQRGWKAARDAWDALIPRVKVAGNVLTSSPKKRRKVRKKVKVVELHPRIVTVQQRILNCIEANPGKTGAEVIRLLGDVNPRTARTMLRRLRIDGKIHKIGEGWLKK